MNARLTAFSDRLRRAWEAIPTSLHLPLVVLLLGKWAWLSRIDLDLANWTMFATQIITGLAALLIFRSRRKSNIHQFSVENVVAGLIAVVFTLVFISIAGIFTGDLWVFELHLLPRLLLPIWIYLLVQASAYPPKADPRFTASAMGRVAQDKITGFVRRRLEKSGQIKPGEDVLIGPPANRAQKRAAKKGRMIVRQRPPR